MTGEEERRERRREMRGVDRRRGEERERKREICVVGRREREGGR